MSSQENLKKILDDVSQACLANNRKQTEVKLLAVSKLQPTEKIIELNQAGQIEFGENYVQELTKKMDELKEKNIKWHLIGHLQKNKIKYILGRCHLIHSVDSFDLAAQISKMATNKSCTENILLEVNLSGEGSKGGFTQATLQNCWPQLVALANINICGLMTMPPLSNENPEDNRPYFRQLKNLLVELKKNAGKHSLNELSMGTTHDFKIAISEGATIVRVGTALFGERPKK